MTETDLINWGLLITIFGVAVMSPGPDFVVAVRNSVLYSRKVGIFTALGFAAGVIVHVTYTLAGLAAIIAHSTVLFSILKYVGAAYLFYMGYKALRSKGFDAPSVDPAEKEKYTLSSWKAFRGGFLTNVLNPKATLFFMAIFSQFVTPETAFPVQILYAATCMAMTALWFSIVAVVLTAPRIKSIFLRAARWIDRICGVLFVGLGLRLAMMTRV
jgi:RhtB (resistance to homoserine/threonine) family protein